MSKSDHFFIEEVDLELLGMIARGKDVVAVAERFGRTREWAVTRLRLLKALFGASTTPHLIAMAIASDVIRCNDLYDESLAGELHVREYGGLQNYHLFSLRAQIADVNSRWWYSEELLKRIEQRSFSHEKA